MTFEGKTYGFADRDGALQFASQPERYLNRAERALATRPELIHAAQGDASTRMDSILDETPAPSTAEFGAQTPTHLWSGAGTRITSGTSGRCVAARCERRTFAGNSPAARRPTRVTSERRRHADVGEEAQRRANRGGQGDDHAEEGAIRRRVERRAGGEDERRQPGARSRPAARIPTSEF